MFLASRPLSMGSKKLNYYTPKCLIDGGSLRGVFAKPKQGARHRFEKMESIKSKAIKVTIISIILHYVMSFPKRIIIFKSHFSFKFGPIRVIFYLIYHSQCFH